ncbi:MAG: hypothetical protein JZU70_06480, partial [Chlorobium sp.]|nr:hypothetical protein [Chlorobium sp.]
MFISRVGEKPTIIVKNADGSETSRTLGLVSSAGDISLTSTTGKITETYSDEDVDIVANTLTLGAFTGITALEVAINVLDAVTTSKNIELTDMDGVDEKTPGLDIKNATTTNAVGNNEDTLVFITAEGELRVGREHKAADTAKTLPEVLGIDSKIRGNTIRLVSTTSSISVVKPSSWIATSPDSHNSLEFNRGIAFNADNTIALYKFFSAPELIEYRAGLYINRYSDDLVANKDVIAQEHLVGDYFLFGTGTTNDPLTNDPLTKSLPSSIISDSVILETGGSLSLDGSISANKLLELVAGEDVSLKGAISVKSTPFDSSNHSGDYEKIDKITIKARGLRDVTQTFKQIENLDGILTIRDGILITLDEKDYNGDGDFDDVVIGTGTAQSSGYINIQLEDLPSENFELRALRDVYLELETDLSLTGFIGGLENFDFAQNVTLNIAGTLSVAGGIVAANDTSGNMQITATSISADSASVFIAKNLEVLATNGVQLNTLVETITVNATESGNISINEANDLIVNSIVANNGTIDITAGGTLKIRSLSTTKDFHTEASSNIIANNINVRALGDLYVDYIEAATSAGAQKTLASITIDAKGTIYEWKAIYWFDANSSLLATPTYSYDQNLMDLYGYRVSIFGTTAAPVVLDNSYKVGTTNELEVGYIAQDVIDSAGKTIKAYTVDTTSHITAATVFAQSNSFINIVSNTTPAGKDIKQISDVVFAVSPQVGYIYAITINKGTDNSHTY